MKIEQQIPRNALFWILLAQFFLLLPHIARLPGWVFVVYLIAAFWRIMVYRGQWSFPPRWLKLILILAGFFGIQASFGSMLGLEPTVALLLVAFALKLIELCERKDAYLVIFLGFFVCLTEFLFSQELLIAAYNLVCVIVLLTALIALHQPGEQKLQFAPLRRASLFVIQAFPLMVVLFVIFPRLPPLWSVPLKSNAAKTGVTDFMSPGDIAQLSRSDEVAFRAEFVGDIPRQSELYWRGLVFSRFAGKTWKPVGWQDTPALERRPQAPAGEMGEGLEYTVIMEPTQQRWLYSLRYAWEHSRNVTKTGDFRLVSPITVQDQYRYSATSYPGAALETDLSDWRRELELELPVVGNQRARTFAVERRNQATSDLAYANDILDFFNEQGFSYTLTPALLGDNTVDDFLFNTREGFCEHYASSFVFLMRSAGVPARVVAGYLGGELNPVNRTVIVRQFDAHAWAEIWLEGRGWTRVDPTSAVSPDRIEWGLERALAGEGSFLADSPLSPIHFRNIDWLNKIRLRYDAITYAWQLAVLSYDSDEQFHVLEEFLGEITPQRVMLFILAAGILSLLPMIGVLLWQSRSHLPKEVRIYNKYCHKLAQLGTHRFPQESPGDFAERAILVHPQLESEIRQVTKLFETIAYSGQPGRVSLAELRHSVRRFGVLRT